MSSTPPPSDQATMAADLNNDAATNETSSAIAKSLIGARVADRYEVKSLLGEGGMGAVYLAEHVMMKKPVALKVLHGELSQNQEIVARFQREAQAAAAINHPNICAATDFGRLDSGAFFLVMEFLEGRTLEALLRARPRLEPERALRVMDQILSVLEMAHDLKIVHRDLKPENVMLVEWDGDHDFVKILDFGIASMRQSDEEEDTRLTRAGVAYGTPTYMSPEQVAGLPEIDGRADLYTLGVMFFEMLTGHLPFKGKTITSLMSQHLTVTPPSISEVEESLRFSPELSAIVAKMLEKEPEDRFQDAASLRAALDALDGDLISGSVPRPGALEHANARALHAPARTSTSTSHPTLLIEAKERFDALPQHFQFATLGIPILFGLIGVVTLVVFGLAATTEPLPDDPTERTAVENERTTKDLAEERDDFITSVDGMRPALEKMASGDHAEARDKLDELESSLAANAHYHYYRGLARVADDKRSEALDSFAMAIQIEPRYRQETQIADAVIEAMEHKKTRKKAREMLVGKLLDAATPKLAELAAEGDKKTRKSAIDLLKETKKWDELPTWRRETIAFKNASGCKPRAEIIAKLEEAESPRALDVLREYADKPKRGCGFLKAKDCYGCIRDDLARAIEVLEKKHPDHKE